MSELERGLGKRIQEVSGRIVCVCMWVGGWVGVCVSVNHE